MASLNRFRIVKLAPELQEEFSLAEFICADPTGMPFWEGEAFFRWLTEDNACELATARNYLNAVLPFLTFLYFHNSPLPFTAPAEQLRYRVQEYLQRQLGCGVRPHRGGNFTVHPVKTITATSARLFITALKRFYTLVILRGWYTDINPMVWTTRLTVLNQEFTPQMPPESGLTLPDEKRGRMPETYFCVVAGDWQPRVLDDPELPRRLLKAFTTFRDRLIARMLFESGARVSEVLRLQLGDWRRRGQGARALTVNKGSHGERVKEIWWSSTTAQLLRYYLQHDRRHSDPQGRGLAALPDSAPLFVSATGSPYHYAGFYFHWQQACQRAGLAAHPHQARHWFVTMALHKFQSLPEPQQATARQSLITYMGWRNPETIKAYDHHIRTLDFAPTHAALTRLVASGTGESVLGPSSDQPLPASEAALPPEMWDQLNQLLDDPFGSK